MDNLGTEVSNKIRSAIKAKLIELDAYVDDELPDYIMVMVANDRTKVLNQNKLFFPDLVDFSCFHNFFSLFLFIFRNYSFLTTLISVF